MVWKTNLPESPGVAIGFAAAGLFVGSGIGDFASAVGTGVRVGVTWVADGVGSDCVVVVGSAVRVASRVSVGFG